MSEKRTNLTPVEKLAVAYVYYTTNATMAQIAMLYPGINQGRIAEACKDVGTAAGIRDDDIPKGGK